MKKIICSLFALSALAASAQSGAKYATGGNATNPGDVLGTTNSQPLNFVTNNVLRMVLDVNGQLKVVNLAGTGSRFLQSDAAGNLISFPNGNSNEVLYGNGTWGTLPAGATSWQIAGNNLLAVNSGNVGIGTNVPQYKLDVIGDARISNNLYVGGGIVITDKVQAAHEVTTMTMRADSIKMDASKAIYGTTRIEGDIDAKNKMDVQGNATFHGTLKNTVLAGGGDKIVYADINGNLKMGPGGGQPGVNGPCVSGAIPWFEGGNYTSQHSSAGTCNAFDFILKSNGTDRIWIQPDGTFSYGAKLLSNTGGPQFRIHNAPVRLSGGGAGFGAPIILFDGGISPYGDWGIEYIDKNIHPQFNKSGLNFWKPFGSPYSFNNIFYLADDGTIGMGTDNPLSRLTLDAWSGDGLRVYSGVNSSKAISLQYKNGNTFTENFVVNGDGVTWIGANVSSVGSAQLVVGQPGLQSKALSLINNSNPSNLQQVFNVYGSGYTEIRSYGTLSNADAFAIKDVSNNDKVNFKIKKNGYAYAREINVMPTTIPFPDYVFESEYELMTLENLEVYLKSNKHLPNIPSAKIVEKEGINLGEMQIKQMEKIEEAFLYILQLKKENDELKARLTALENNK